MNGNGRDITSIVLAVLFIGGLLGASLWILSPFLGPAIWATTLVVSTWPLMTVLQARLWRSRSLAITLMTIVIFCVFIVPLGLAINAIVSHADQIAGPRKGLRIQREAPSKPPIKSTANTMLVMSRPFAFMVDSFLNTLQRLIAPSCHPSDYPAFLIMNA